MRTLEWHCLCHQELQLTPGDQAGPWNMAAIVLARLTDIDEGELGTALQQLLESVRSYRIGHDWSTSTDKSRTLQGLEPWRSAFGIKHGDVTHVFHLKKRRA